MTKASDIFNALWPKKEILSPLDFLAIKSKQSVEENIKKLGYKLGTTKAFVLNGVVFISKLHDKNMAASLLIPEPLIYEKLLKSLKKKNAIFIIYEHEYAYLVGFKEGEFDFYKSLPGSGLKHCIKENLAEIKEQLLGEIKDKKSPLFSINLPFNEQELGINKLSLSKDYKEKLLAKCKIKRFNLTCKEKPSKKRGLILAACIFAPLLGSLMISFYYKYDEEKVLKSQSIIKEKIKLLKKQNQKYLSKKSNLFKLEQKQAARLNDLQNILQEEMLKQKNIQVLASSNDNYKNLYMIISLLNKEGLTINSISLNKDEVKITLLDQNLDAFLAKIAKKTRFFLKSSSQSGDLSELILRDVKDDI